MVCAIRYWTLIFAKYKRLLVNVIFHICNIAMSVFCRTMPCTNLSFTKEIIFYLQAHCCLFMSFSTLATLSRFVEELYPLTSFDFFMYSQALSMKNIQLQSIHSKLLLRKRLNDCLVKFKVSLYHMKRTQLLLQLFNFSFDLTRYRFTVGYRGDIYIFLFHIIVGLLY